MITSQANQTSQTSHCCLSFGATFYSMFTNLSEYNFNLDHAKQRYNAWVNLGYTHSDALEKVQTFIRLTCNRLTP